MKSKAHKAIAEAASALGISEVREEANVVIVDYNGATVRISRDMSTSKATWDVVIDGMHLGTERSPSGAFKRAVKIVDRRRHEEAADIEALNNVCADKKALLLLRSEDRVVVEFDGKVVAAKKGLVYWTVECEDISTRSLHAPAGIAHVICTLQERSEIAEQKAEMAEPAEAEEPVRDYLVDEDPSDDDAPLLTDLAEVQYAIAETFQLGDADHTTSADELRAICNIADEIEDHEILDALGEAIRDEGAPVVVFTLGCDRVELQIEQVESERDAVATAEEVLTDISGSQARLSRVGSHEEGDGILRAYRVPSGDYEIEDFETIERFGVEVGRYRVEYAEAA